MENIETMNPVAKANELLTVKGHMKVWHKEAGKQYADDRGELVIDKSNTIAAGLLVLLRGKLSSNATDASLDDLFTTSNNGAANYDVMTNTTRPAGISAKDGIVLFVTDGTYVIEGYPMVTTKASVGNGWKFTGTFTRTTSTKTFTKVAIGHNLRVFGSIPQQDDAGVEVFNTAYAYNTLNRTMNIGDQLTVEWTINIA